jgi:hypothetical protein
MWSTTTKLPIIKGTFMSNGRKSRLLNKKRIIQHKHEKTQLCKNCIYFQKNITSLNKCKHSDEPRYANETACFRFILKKE